MNELAQKNSARIDSQTSDSALGNALFYSEEEPLRSKGEKYIIFCLGADFFAVSSNKVSEVVQMLAVTPLPNVPEWLVGIADLRGAIISVVSLRKLLGKPDATFSPRSKFIVLKSPNISSPIALAVDRLSEIVFVPIGEIQPLEEKAPYLLGKTTYKFNDLSLLNVESLLSALAI